MKRSKIFKDWNLFEVIFLFSSVIVVTACFFVGSDKNILSFATSLIGVVVVILCAKGFAIAPCINIVYNILYSILAIMQKYYGEAIIYIFIMMPMSICLIVSWFRNRSNENKTFVEINKIEMKEYLYLFLIAALATVGFYFLLKALDTSQLIVSTISLSTSLVATYLMIRRCKYYALGYILNDIVLIVLWSIVASNSGSSYVPMVVCFAVFLINDIYGLILWLLKAKTQEEKKRELESKLQK